MLRTAAATGNRLNSNALTDEQVTWEHFMEISSLVLWQIENHDDIAIPGGKETLLLSSLPSPRSQSVAQ